MRQLGLLVVAFAIFSLTACSKKDDKGSGSAKTNEEKILGKREVTEPGRYVPPGAVLEFQKDGKLIITAEVDEETKSVPGTYKIEGDKLILTRKGGPKDIKETLKIKTLTDTQLVTEDERGKVDEHTKK